MLMNLARTAGAGALAVLAFLGAARAQSPDVADAQAVIGKAEAALRAFRADPAYRALPASVRSAEAVLIVPGYVRAGIGIGGAAGTGVLLRKEASGAGWSAPAFFDLRAANLGPQLGYQRSDVVITIHNRPTLESILAGDLSLGAEAGYVAGAQTDSAEASATVSNLRVFTRSEGAYAGAVVGGARIDPNDRLNRAFYGSGAAPARIISEPAPARPDSDRLRAELAALIGGRS